jgi:hypothetical protein
VPVKRLESCYQEKTDISKMRENVLYQFWGACNDMSSKAAKCDLYTRQTSDVVQCMC